MKKIVVILLLGTLSLFGYTDSDLDGVVDAQDRCPNTPFMTLVDINGCAKKTLVPKSTPTSPHHFDIIMGLSYSDADYNTLNTTDTYASSLQADYYYKNFSVQASTSYYYTDGSGYSDSGLYDTFIGASYQMKFIKNLTTRLSVGVLLPTYDASLNNNNTDYTASLSLSYLWNKYTLFGGFGYTLINDDDVTLVDTTTNTTTLVEYQDITSFNLGVGYYINSALYISGSFSDASSIYKGYDDLQTATLYGYYGIDRHWFSTFSYSYGISDTASNNYISLKLGYFF